LNSAVARRAQNTLPMPNLMQMFGSEDAKHDRILYVAFDWTRLPFFGEAA